MHKFELYWTKIKGGCQSGRKVAPHDSKSDLPLTYTLERRNRKEEAATASTTSA